MRKIRIASVSFLLDDAPHTIEQNIYRACAYIEDAARRGADVVLLPECVTTAGVREEDRYMAERYPGEWTKAFRACSKKNSINVIAPYWVRARNKIFNQASIINRNGSVTGLYRKLQPTAEELRYSSAGADLPVVELDFGKIAIMICMDIYFPEIARIYAMKGAEVLFWATTTVGPSQEGLDAQIRSRAIDNSIYVVESNYAQAPPYAPYAGRFRPGNARIIDYNGDVIASTGRREGLAIAEIDLDAERITSGVIGKHNPDHTRQDMEEQVRLDFYAKEYTELAAARNRSRKSKRK